MNNITISDSICSLYPTCKWTLSDNDYSTLWWDENNQFPIPNLKELEDEVKRLQEEYEFNEYQRQRAKEYPSFADQFDILYHGGYDAWKAKIDEVKDKYPKPE